MCLGFMPRFWVAILLAALLAAAQSAAVAVPKANRARPGLMLPGIVSSASALQVQVHPQLGFAGAGIVLGAEEVLVVVVVVVVVPLPEPEPDDPLPLPPLLPALPSSES